MVGWPGHTVEQALFKQPNWFSSWQQEYYLLEQFPALLIEVEHNQERLANSTSPDSASQFQQLWERQVLLLWFYQSSGLLLYWFISYKCFSVGAWWNSRGLLCIISICTQWSFRITPANVARISDSPKIIPASLYLLAQAFLLRLILIGGNRRRESRIMFRDNFSALPRSGDLCNLTPELSGLALSVVMLLMFIGGSGPLTLLVVWLRVSTR